MSHFKSQYRQLCDGVWVWDHFLSKDELEPIMEEILSKDWNTPTAHLSGFTTFKQYKDRILDSLNMPHAEIDDLDYCIRRGINGGMQPHVDIPNYMNIVHYNEIDASSTLPKISLRAARYGMIIYFNDDYVHGDICYPEEDICYKPKAGDLVVHDVRKIHAVRVVKPGLSEHRYTHSSYIADEFWVTEEIYKNIDRPKEGSGMEDFKNFYSIQHGPSLNPALAKFTETYIDEGKY